MLRALGLALLSAFAPRHCAGCGSPGERAICAACAALIVRLPQPPERRPPAGPVSAAFPYEGPVRRIIHRAKYGGERDALEALAELGSVRLEDRLLASPDVLVPVPLGRRRRRRRGFNQATIIAGVLGRRSDVPLSEELARLRETPSQVGRGGEQRRRNVDGCFAWRGPPLEGAAVWLVDDVLTTGSTLAAASRALLEAGAGDVEAAVLADSP